MESVEGWEGGVRKTDLLKPSADHNDLRANVVIKAGPAADEIRKLAEKWQMDPAAVIRMLAIQGLDKAV